MHACLYFTSIILAVFISGCVSAGVSQVERCEKRLAELEEQFTQVRHLGLRPEKVRISPELGEEIESLCVYPPYLQTAASVFPGCFSPGLGARIMGQSFVGDIRMKTAYYGAGEFAAGVGLFIVALPLSASIGPSGTAVYEQDPFIRDLWDTCGACLIGGPAKYLRAWLDDISWTFSFRDDLSERAQALKKRYRSLLFEYMLYRREYNSRSR